MPSQTTPWLDEIIGTVQTTKHGASMVVWAVRSRDNSLASAFCGPRSKNSDLVFVVLMISLSWCRHLARSNWRELALEDRYCKWSPKSRIALRLSKTLIIGDVVTDEVCASHGVRSVTGVRGQVTGTDRGRSSHLIPLVTLTWSLSILLSLSLLFRRGSVPVATTRRADEEVCKERVYALSSGCKAATSGNRC